jgi:hypothetical protein
MQIVRSGLPRRAMACFVIIVACIGLAPVLSAAHWLIGARAAALFGWTAC